MSQGDPVDREEILHGLERCETLLQNIVQILQVVGAYDRVDSCVGGLLLRGVCYPVSHDGGGAVSTCR